MKRTSRAPRRGTRLRRRHPAGHGRQRLGRGGQPQRGLPLVAAGHDPDDRLQRPARSLVRQPARKAWRRSGPGFALYLFDELFGRTTSKGKYVYLSDGGHFENLGVYELVRRRCRYIVVCDAGADPTLSFWDLAGLVRKCREDFGVRIEIDVSPLSRKEGTRSRAMALRRGADPLRGRGCWRPHRVRCSTSSRH